MNQRQFFSKFAVVCGVAVVAVFFMGQHSALEPHQGLSWFSVGAFTAITLLMYFAGRRTAASSNKNDFTNAILGFTVLKLFLAIAVIFSYIQLFQPEGKLFILPFFFAYFWYTIFETYFMMRLGRSSGVAPKQDAT